MRNTGLEEAQAGIKIAGRNINNLRYADNIAHAYKEYRSGTHEGLLTCNGTPLKYSCLENPVDGGAW